MNPNAVYVKRQAPVSRGFVCGHCNAGYTRTEAEDGDYVEHVKRCIETKIWAWNEAEYSKTYFKQVRATSRYKEQLTPKRRSQFRAWGWWLVKPAGPVLMKAEVS